jgi:hypothetical protein
VSGVSVYQGNSRFALTAKFITKAGCQFQSTGSTANDYDLRSCHLLFSHIKKTGNKAGFGG